MPEPKKKKEPVWSNSAYVVQKRGEHYVTGKQDPGVYYVTRNKYEDGTFDESSIWICSPLKITALGRDKHDDNWLHHARWWDPDGNEHEGFIAAEWLEGGGLKVWQYLASGGVRLALGEFKHGLLLEYIQSREPTPRVRTVSGYGWYKGMYVLPDKIIGPGAEEEVIQSADSPDHLLRVAGTLEEWKRNVGCLCRGNTRLVFGISAAITGPTLELFSEESILFHLVGLTSIGKTTVLMVAGSVWGGGGRNGFVETWRSTTNALEATARVHNDGFFPIDELSAADARHLGQAVYMLGNNEGKARMTADAQLRKRIEWRFVGLSSGELGLEEHIRSVKGRVQGGQQVRFIEIEADAGKGLGCFENIHGEPNADTFARRLSEASKRYYGTVIREFLELLTFCKVTATDRIQELYRQYVTDMVKTSKSTPGEVSRVARKFARVAATGEYAIENGVLPFAPGEALKAAKTCFRSWKERRGNIKGSSDAERGINAVRAFLQTQVDRFPFANADDSVDIRPSAAVSGSGIIHNRAGYRQHVAPPLKGIEFLIFPTVFVEEICRDLDHKLTARTLHERGFLVPESKRLQNKRKVGGSSQRFYVVKASLLDAEE
jgi:uncharacterized protein (DUF927 family)